MDKRGRERSLSVPAGSNQAKTHNGDGQKKREWVGGITACLSCERLSFLCREHSEKREEEEEMEGVAGGRRGRKKNRDPCRGAGFGIDKREDEKNTKYLKIKKIAKKIFLKSKPHYHARRVNPTHLCPICTYGASLPLLSR